MTRRARKELQSLPAKDRERVVAAMGSLGTDPFQGKKLQGEWEGKWSLRVWPYRIIYTVEKEIVTVTVLRVGHRRDAYR
ncbi:MAG: type II toxin-antitoxin system RelE/ParE family toxin [Candidatus Peribacteraceae bacterium]